ncbi:uncharacterized protein LOC129619285 isoform X1 [Condylostylus longicornis]|uniref:uncharacterized protein LOC129619285 isoform X1 n=1 Tax=Condylostylus longicornis TaxID=2530218 RepID=UPI00244D9E0C|nr:uncharacterized protein LOC129619285 isoform X1 [Condylostylus longicornis]
MSSTILINYLILFCLLLNNDFINGEMKISNDFADNNKFSRLKTKLSSNLNILKQKRQVYFYYDDISESSESVTSDYFYDNSEETTSATPLYAEATTISNSIKKYNFTIEHYSEIFERNFNYSTESLDDSKEKKIDYENFESDFNSSVRNKLSLIIIFCSGLAYSLKCYNIL